MTPLSPCRGYRTAVLTLVLSVVAALGALSAAPAQAAPADDIRINEVVTTGDVNDSIELHNTGTSTVDLSSWVLRDENSSPVYTISSGTTLAAGAFRSFDVHNAFGLGSADKARLYLPGGSTLVDSFTWTSHSGPSWSRCPDGTGSFAQAATLTLGGPNNCAVGAGGLSPTTWPGGSAVATADGASVLGSDVSGLYQEGGVLWAAQNSGKLWRLVPDGATAWKPDTTSGWTSGKTLRFPGGSGTPDDEGVTLTSAGSSGGVYVASERNASASGTSRLSVLRYDVSGSTTTLDATQEWNLTGDLPPVGANLGLEAVTWISDSALTAAGFRDASTGAAYNPSLYGAHTGGVFLVGVEATGMIYAYVLADSGTVTRIASIGTGLAGVMELQWQPAAARLWVVCDNTCSGQHRTLQINGSGVLAVTAIHNRPGGMSNYNNEGFSIDGTCTAGTTPVTWADDSNDNSHALRRGTLTC